MVQNLTEEERWRLDTILTPPERFGLGPAAAAAQAQMHALLGAEEGEL